jgi:hypothetical protein
MLGALAVTGWALMGIAVLMWIAMLAVPFLGVFEGRRAAAFLVLWLGGEILFATGALMAAPQLLRGRTDWLKRLFRRDPS